MKFKKSVRMRYFMVLSGSMIALGCGFLVSIVATHVIKPADYGFYKAFLIALQMFATFSLFGFHYTFGREFALASSVQKKLKLNSSAIMIFIIIYVGVAITTFTFSFFSKITLNSTLPDYVLLASIFVFVLLFQNYTQQKLQGQSKMIRYTILTTLPQVLMAIFFIAVLLLHLDINGLHAVIAYVLINTLILIFLSDYDFSFRIGKAIKDIISINKTYGLQLYIGSLFSVSSGQLLNLLIVNISGLEEYAFFALGISLASPMAFIPSTLGIVQFKRNVKAKFIGKREITATLAISGISMLGYYAFLNYLMPYLIGDEYLKAIPYANILMIYYTIMGLGDYLNSFIRAKGNSINLRNSAIVTGIVLIITAIIFIPLLQINGLILAKMIGALLYLSLMIIVYKKIKIQ